MSFFDTIKTFARGNKIEILSGISIVGTMVTGYLSFQAGRKAQTILDESEKDMAYVKKGDKEARNEVIRDTAKQIIPIVLPPVLVGIGSIAANIGSLKASSRRIAVLTAAYTLSEKTARDLNDKMVEMIGENKARKVRERIVKDKAEKNPPSQVQETMIIGSGEVLCMDVYSGRYFHSDPDKIRQSVFELSEKCQSEMYVSLNDLYDLINSPELPIIPMGNDFGWNADDLYKGIIPVEYSSILTPGRKPCLCIDYTVAPREDYRNLH